MSKTLISTRFHKIPLTSWPKKMVSVFRDDDVEVVQSMRNLRFYYRFTISDVPFLFFTEQFDIGYLQRCKDIIRKFRAAYAETVAALDVPSDVWYGAKPKQLKNEGS